MQLQLNFLRILFQTLVLHSFVFFYCQHQKEHKFSFAFFIHSHILLPTFFMTFSRSESERESIEGKYKRNGNKLRQKTTI